MRRLRAPRSPSRLARSPAPPAPGSRGLTGGGRGTQGKGFYVDGRKGGQGKPFKEKWTWLSQVRIRQPSRETRNPDDPKTHPRSLPACGPSPAGG